MESRKENPIALRSKKWITESLFELMQEKNFEDISITDIAKKADLVRQTFYKNFNSKEDVINEYIESLSNEMIHECSPINGMSIDEAAQLHFKFWEKHADFVRLLMKHNLQHLISRCYEKFLFVFNENFLKKDPQIIKYSSIFIIGGVLNCITEWIKDDLSMPLDKISLLASQIINGKFFLE